MCAETRLDGSIDRRDRDKSYGTLLCSRVQLPFLMISGGACNQPAAKKVVKRKRFTRFADNREILTS
jgi:hypothetical protein